MAGSASSASTGRAGTPNSAAARLGRRGIGVGERDDVEDREVPRRLQIGGADVAAADDADADAASSQFSCLQGERGSRIGRRPRRAPRRAVEIAQRHRRRAAPQIPSLHSRTTMSATSARLGGSSAATRLAQRPDEDARWSPWRARR